MLGFIVRNQDDWWNALAAISTGGNGTEDYPKEYKITVLGDVPFAGSKSSSTFGDAENIKVIFNGKGTLKLNSEGWMLNIEKNQTVVIDGPTLHGLSNNTFYSSTLIYVNNNATLILNKGALTENHVSTANASGGAVWIDDNGTFIMNGGTISNNSVNDDDTYPSGGGVANYGTFIMNGGIITGNSAYIGGGVYVGDNSSFTMNGGTIAGNTGEIGMDVSYKYDSDFINNGGFIDKDVQRD